MGGIPWQSRGCKTCKNRRIKCDLQEPECVRCIKRGLSCPGYVKDRVFIHHTAVQPAVASNQLKYDPTRQIVLSGHRERITVAPQFVHDGPQIRTQLSSVLFHAYVPLEPNRTGGVDAWLYLLEQFLALPNKSEMLERAISALSCIYVGKMNNDNHLIRHGVQQYNLSIRLMHGLLRRNIRTPEVLYVTVIFQVLEALYCPNGLQIWIAHQDGMHALLRYFRPTTPCNLLVRAIYENQQKIHFMFSATASRRIGSPRHPPVYSFEGGLLNELFNFFLNIVSILEKLEEVDRSDYGNCQDLLETSLAQKKAMITWYNQRSDEIGGAPTRCVPGTILCAQLPLTDDLFGPAYNFSSLDTAIMHLLYWTAMILIQSLIYQTRCLIVYYGRTISSDPTTNEEFKLTGTYAAQICCAVPYCLQPKMRLGGAHATVATLNQVCKTYAHRRCQQHYLWCQSAYRHIGDLGLDSARHLCEGNTKYWDLCTNPYVNSVLSLTLRFAVPPELLRFLQSIGSSEGKVEGSEQQPTDIYDPQ